MPKQKLYIIIAVSVLVVILFLIFILTLVQRKQSTPQGSEAPVPTLNPEEEQAEVLENIQHVVEHHEEEFSQTAVIRDAELVLLEDGIPDNFKKDEFIQPVATSPNGTFSAIVTDNLLTIKRTRDQSIVTSIPLGTNLESYTFTWIRDSVLVLVEKQKTDLRIDNIYLINTTNPEKLFVAGSFPAVSRFNLSVPIEIYNEGTSLVFTDNEAQKWLLFVEYKQ